MLDWESAARAEVAALKPHFVAKHGWNPRWADERGADAIDLLVSMAGRRFPGQAYLLRLRYQPDWREAGRREAFVDPLHPGVASTRHWPPEGNGINPNYVHANTPLPVICLRGVFGYHSVLHPDRPMEHGPGSLLLFLVELQQVMDR